MLRRFAAHTHLNTRKYHNLCSAVSGQKCKTPLSTKTSIFVLSGEITYASRQAG